LLAGYITTLLAERLANATEFVAAPNPLVAQHVRPVAYLGGLGVLGGVVCGVVVSGRPAPENYLIAGIALYTLLGVVDDARPFRPGAKLTLQLAVAIVAVAMGLRANLTGVPLVDDAFLVFLVVMLVNAVNFTDVCDGLVASLGVVALGAAAIVLHPANVSICLAGSGACAGFLLRNKPPACIVLGDAGSHLIGFLLAAVWIGAIATGGAHNVIRGALVYGVFLFELLFITSVRIWKGLPWWRGSPDHFSLRMQAAGWSRGQLDAAAALSAAALGFLGWAVSKIGALPAVLCALTYGAAVSVYLLRCEIGSARARTESER
jgi:UDP-GlcNAc:undecaprenyl-phosphate GlcNAc-1-phosphate transferase